MMIPVPIVRQAYEYSCGAASLASCLYHWEVWDGREPELYPLLNTTEDGTSGESIVRVAQSFGLTAKSKSQLTLHQLGEYVRDGYTVILSIQAWGNWDNDTDMNDIWDDGHYVVLVGILWGKVIFMDPGIPKKYRALDIDQFMEVWHDYNDAGDHDWYGAIVIRKE